MGRTHLTTPPGDTPETEVDRRRDGGERYSPGLELPDEPNVPSRYRTTLLTVVTVAVLAVVTVTVFRLVFSGQDFDPAFRDQPTPTSRPATPSG